MPVLWNAEGGAATCTGLSFTTSDHYFGRNLDLEFHYHETVAVTPRNRRLEFREAPALDHHHAIIGIATIADGYPLYYDATNEKGLSMAGLNFPGNADYEPPASEKLNIAPFEFIPWVLGQFDSVGQVKRALNGVSLADISFSEKLPVSPLYWIIADADGAITVESVASGLRVYDNPYGVLTNNPPFDMQTFRLNDYRHLSAAEPENTFAPGLPLDVYSRGMGGIGLPGDLSSSSRFVRAVFTRMHSVSGTSESESLSQFFHILGSVAQQRGCALVAEDGEYEITIYSSCCNTSKGIGVEMHREDLDGEAVIDYPLVEGQQIHMQN